MTKSTRPTRFYSNKQEKSVAKAINAKQVVNSGAAPFNKGDVISDLFLIECKTKINTSKQISVKKEWIEKNKSEAFAMGKHYSALAINFGDSENFYIIDEKLFKILHEKLQED